MVVDTLQTLPHKLKGVTIEDAIEQLQQAITEQMSRSEEMHESNFQTRC